MDPRFNVFARIIPGKFRAPSGKLPDMKCPHCGKEISETVHEPAVGSRQYLIAWLTAWRKENGLGDSGRPISNRSLPQLQKMYDEAQRGKLYRAGRRWGRPKSSSTFRGGSL